MVCSSSNVSSSPRNSASSASVASSCSISVPELAPGAPERVLCAVSASPLLSSRCRPSSARVAVYAVCPLDTLDGGPGGSKGGGEANGTGVSFEPPEV
eukprot:scaffold38606_cov63-Phaeocystis_antarctica.AAC.3